MTHIDDYDQDLLDLHDIEDMEGTTRTSAPMGYCSGCGEPATVGTPCCDGESVDPA